MALPPIDCDIPTEVCCSIFFDIASHLLVNVFNALDECYGADSGCKPVTPYVTMGDGDDGYVDALTVEIGDVRPASVDANGRTPLVAVYRADYNLRLKESGWPMATTAGHQIILPDAEKQNAIARHAYGHGERMWRKVVGMHSTRQLVPPGLDYNGAVIGALTKLPPTTGVIGWLMKVTVDVPRYV